MRILINSTELDVTAGQEVSFHFANMRFSDVFANSFSTDFDLPLTSNNIRILGVYGLIDRPQQLFGSLIECQVLTRGENRRGRMQINSIKNGAVNVTLYMSELPTELSLPLARLIPDTAATIYSWLDWESRAYETPSSSRAFDNKTYYDRGDGIPVMPNVKLSELFARIATASGMTINTGSLADYRLMCSRLVVCPQNQRQIALYQLQNVIMQKKMSGQHITNEIADDPVVINDVAIYPTDFNRDCSVTVAITAVSTTGLPDESITLWKRHNDEWQQIRTYAPESSSREEYVTIEEGDAIGVSCIMGGWLMVDLTISEYEIREDDYDTKLTLDVGADYSTPSWYTGGGAYVYIGIMCCLPKLTAKELLSAIGWQIGKIIEVNDMSLTYNQPNRYATIDAEIVSYAPQSDALGRVNEIQGADGGQLTKFYIDAVLQAEKVFHKSPFVKLATALHGDSMQWAVIDLFERTEPFDFVGVEGGVLTVAASSGTTSYLTAPTAVSFLGVDSLAFVMEIEGVTLADITHLDYVVINTHTYMVEEGDTDELTGMTNFKALLI